MGGPDHELWSNGHPARGGPASIYSTMNHANYVGQASCTSNMGHDELHHPVSVRCWITVHVHPPLFMLASPKVPVGHRGNQTYGGGYPTATGNNQYTPIRPEYRTPAAPVSASSPSTCV